MPLVIRNITGKVVINGTRPAHDGDPVRPTDVIGINSGSCTIGLLPSGGPAADLERKRSGTSVTAYFPPSYYLQAAPANKKHRKLIRSVQVHTAGGLLNVSCA